MYDFVIVKYRPLTRVQFDCTIFMYLYAPESLHHNEVDDFFDQNTIHVDENTIHG